MRAKRSPLCLPPVSHRADAGVYITYSHLRHISRPRYDRIIMEEGTLDSTIMFCSSLRNRPVWTVLSPILLSSSEIQLQGTSLLSVIIIHLEWIITRGKLYRSLSDHTRLYLPYPEQPGKQAIAHHPPNTFVRFSLQHVRDHLQN
jgi:hypothetical protein